MKIVFFHPNIRHLRTTDVSHDAVEYGGGFSGTETALVQVGHALAQKGHSIHIVGMADHSYENKGLYFWSLYHILADASFWGDVNIYCPLFYLHDQGHAAILQMLNRNSVLVWLWYHCFISDSSVEHFRSQGWKLIASFVSEWQCKHCRLDWFLSSTCIGNGISPLFLEPSTLQTPNERAGNWIYHATMERGGSVAQRVLEYVNQRNPRAAHTLHYASYYAPDQNHRPTSSSCSIVLHGSLSKREVAALLGKSDYFVYPLVLPSGHVHHDTYGSVILEAISRGVIVVTWNVACIPTVYQKYVVAADPAAVHGYNADAPFGMNTWMLSDEATAMLGEKVLWLENNPGEKEEIRRRGMKWAQQQTWEVRGTLYDEWLSQLS